MWESPERVLAGGPATAIVEAKALGADLSGTGRPRQDRPKDQIARYTTGCRFAGPGTLGALTDGNVWHLVAAKPGQGRTACVAEFRLLDDSAVEAAEALEKMRKLLSTAAEPRALVPAGADSARALIDAAAEGEDPPVMLALLSGADGHLDRLGPAVRLEGKAEAAESVDWDCYAFAPAGVSVISDLGDLEGNRPCVAVVRMTRPEPDDSATLHRGDVATAAAAFAASVACGVSVVLVVLPDASGTPAGVRLAVRHRGHTGMTVQFDPHAPAPHALRAVQRVMDALRSEGPVDAEDLAGAVSAAGVQKEFYDSITGWVLRQHRAAKGGVDKKRTHREAVMRHLIRTLFVWILKEDGKLPEDVFEKAFADRCAPGGYHRDVLGFLFHERLNRPEAVRGPHPVDDVDRALDGVPFLNGSLFARHAHDGNLMISDDEYFRPADGEKPPGLFTILSDYDWTASEHLPDHSDQTIDPEVLGSLFENLIAVTEAGDTPKRMPRGTYYTPADVAAEMTIDALTLAVRDYKPSGWSEQDLMDLFRGGPPGRSPALSDPERSRLADRIESLTVFDPCVGSGVFLVAALHAIRGALAGLGRGDGDGAVTRRIVSRQLHAQDIHPMAAQITRLRLFLAWIAAEPAGLSGPLPNLEAKVVCADTLRTSADRGWGPAATGTLQDDQDEITDALRQRGMIFSRWQDAHDETDKANLRAEDDAARARLEEACRLAGVAAETAAFAEHRLLDPEAPPALTDARLLFYQPDWAGFDVVIGNPPYENPKLGPGGRDRLSRLGYKTIKCGDLYALIAEAGLTLANPDKGVLTLIVPLSVCFGQNKTPLRALLEASSSEIRVRSQDNRPDTTFKASPVAHPENSQRTSILSVVTSTAGTEPEIQVTGASKWPKSQRHTFLQHRQYTPKPRFKTALDNRLDRQWERIPTHEFAALVAAMRSARTKIRDLQHREQGTEQIAFPPTARYYVTTTPTGRLERGESSIRVGGKDGLRLSVATANSHPAYAWWKTYGDAFHIKPCEIETIAIPDTWLNHPATRQRILFLAEQLIAAIIPDNIDIKTSGTMSTQHENIDFHDCAPDVIAEIDELYITGLNLKPEPLLAQLRALRTNTTWKPPMT